MMINRRPFKLFFLLLFFFSSGSFNLYGKEKILDYSILAKVPILHAGRIKPLDTFARVQLLGLYEKSSLKQMTAMEWMMELLFNPGTAYQRRIFKLRNKDVLKALQLTYDPSNNYSFMEVSKGISRESKLIRQIAQIPPKQRTPAQKQIHELYYKLTNYFELSRSLSLLLPTFAIEDQEHAQKLKLPYQQPLTYLDISKRQTLYSELLQSLLKKKGKHSPAEIALIHIGRKLEMIGQDFHSQNFRIIPPPFKKSIDQEWTSPWQTIQQGLGTPSNLEYFNDWTQLSLAYERRDQTEFKNLSQKLYQKAMELSGPTISAQKLLWEYRYNTWDLFTVALSLYILGFLLLATSWLGKGKLFSKMALASVTIGGVLHFTNLAIRCYIMARPPVSTLYESIIFVSFICVFSALLLEFRRRNKMGTFLASCLGTILLFLSFSYERDGDSMGMLVAVLDTNFWLATHVVTITIGYGCCFVTSMIGHIYLVQRVLEKMLGRSFDTKTTLKNMRGATLFALFFTVLGTILGGIWADQSWGRFWGWDPKENGAMLICMWLLLSTHGRLTSFFRPLSFAITTTLTSVVVAYAWFGVNLLSVGLHSYGFTESAAFNLFLFTAIELIFCATVLIILKTWRGREVHS